MKKISRRSFLAAAGLSVAALALTACGSSASSVASSVASSAASSAAASTSAAAGELTTVEAGKLTMATNAAFPPYEMTTDAGDFEGIDIETAQAIADKLGLKLKIEDMEFDSIITAVSTGKADLGLAGMTVTPDRQKNVDFSDTYANGVQVIIVKEDSAIAKPDDLKGKKIGVQLSTTGDLTATDEFGKDSVVQYNKGNDAVMALTQGQVDAVIIDNEPAKSYVEANKGLKILDTEFLNEDYAACISKDNAGLTKAVNKALAELKADGTLQKIVDKYIKA